MTTPRSILLFSQVRYRISRDILKHGRASTQESADLIAEQTIDSMSNCDLLRAIELELWEQ